MSPNKSTQVNLPDPRVQELEVEVQSLKIQKKSLFVNLNEDMVSIKLITILISNKVT